MSLYLYLRGAT